MASVLLVEDSPLVIKIIKYLLSNSLNIEPIVASTLADTKKVVESGEDILCSIVDLNLPDAPNGEALDYLLARDVPSIVLTGDYNEDRRKAMLQKSIVDYIVKESRYSYEYVARLIRRLQRNQKIKVLVADDAPSSRAFITQLLSLHLYQVIEASDGQEALERLKEQPDIRLLITDYNMPNMNGFELTSQLRRDPQFADLVVIGLSATDDSGLSAKFIKAGANDFLTKPFCHEEFYCRIMHNVETVELLETVRRAANSDYLTGLANRRYFFSEGDARMKRSAADAKPVIVAMMDVDYFKSINDGYGHDMGDLVLKDLAQLLVKSFPGQLVARMGGEEFAVLITDIDEIEVEEMLERFRGRVENHDIAFGDVHFSFTLSTGYTSQIEDSLEAMINTADKYLYQAKEDGRNQVQGK